MSCYLLTYYLLVTYFGIGHYYQSHSVDAIMMSYMHAQHMIPSYTPQFTVPYVMAMEMSYIEPTEQVCN